MTCVTRVTGFASSPASSSRTRKSTPAIAGTSTIPRRSSVSWRALTGLTDRDELARRLSVLLVDKKKAYRPYRGVILARALELSARLGEEFARTVLNRVMPGLADLADSPEAQVLILEKGLYLAAHYDQAPFATTFVERFLKLLSASSTIDPGDRTAAPATLPGPAQVRHARPGRPAPGSADRPLPPRPGFEAASPSAWRSRPSKAC